jgi:hypothetical protein
VANALIASQRYFLLALFNRNMTKTSTEQAIKGKSNLARPEPNILGKRKEKGAMTITSIMTTHPTKTSFRL